MGSSRLQRGIKRPWMVSIWLKATGRTSQEKKVHLLAILPAILAATTQNHHSASKPSASLPVKRVCSGSTTNCSRGKRSCSLSTSGRRMTRTKLPMLLTPQILSPKVNPRMQRLARLARVTCSEALKRKRHLRVSWLMTKMVGASVERTQNLSTHDVSRSPIRSKSWLVRGLMFVTQTSSVSLLVPTAGQDRVIQDRQIGNSSRCGRQPLSSQHHNNRAVFYLVKIRIKRWQILSPLIPCLQHKLVDLLSRHSWLTMYSSSPYENKR